MQLRTYTENVKIRLFLTGMQDDHHFESMSL